jgi:uncharacterized damage-inducible protein DinB
MLDKIQSLQKKFESVYNGDPWYGDSVKSISALIKVEENSHSIAELVSHMIAWREFLLKRLHRDKDFDVDQEDSFDWKRIDKNERTAWKSLLNTLEKNQKEILSALEKLDNNFLNLPVSKRKYNMNYLIEGIIQHDLYHAGQISLLTKLTEMRK